MKVYIKRAIILALGWSFILIGIAGLFLPILQGVLFLLIGLFILSHEYAWAHKILCKIREKFPALDKKLETAKINMERIVKAFKK